MEYDMKRRMRALGLTGVFLGLGLVACESAKVSGSSDDIDGSSPRQKPRGDDRSGPAIGATDGATDNEDRVSRLAGAAVASDSEAESLIQNDSEKGAGVIYVTLNHMGPSSSADL